MPYQDFRQFLDVLRQQGELVDVDRPIALNDVGKAMKQSYARQGPALMFKENGTDFPLVCGVYSTRNKALLAFQTDEAGLFDKVLKGLDKAIPPVIVNGSAPCHEVVITGDDIDLTRLPVPQYSPKDGGPYITPGIVVSKDPETGVPDIGHYRVLVLGKNTFSYSAQPFHRFGKNLAKCKKLGIVPRAALVIGVDPILAYTCQVQVPDDTNDWHLAGGFRGAPVELVRCKTCDLEVPATAEMVIEFEVDLDRTVMEGPLGEYTGYYTRPSHKPVATVTAITHRRNAIFQGLLTGKPVTENHILKQVPFEASVFRTLKRQFPDHREGVGARVGGRVVLSRDRHAAALRRRGAPGDHGGDGEQHPAEMDDHRRPRHRRAFLDRGRMGDGVPRPAASRRHRRRQRAGGAVRSSVDLTRERTMRTASMIGIDATRPFGEPFYEVADVPGWQDFEMPELDR